MKRLFLAFAMSGSIVFALPASAQDTMDLAREYSEIPEVQMMFDDMFSPDLLAQQFRLGVPPEIEISDSQLAQIGEVMAEMMGSLRPQLTEMMVEGMGANYTAEELTALNEFWRSPIGASVMGKMQPFFQQIMADFMPLIQQRQQEYLPALIAILEE